MTRLEIPASRSEALSLDAQDPLAHCRSEFSIPENTTYLVGHSLGPLSRSAAERLSDAYNQHWQNEIVGAWNSADWISLPQTVGAKIAPLIGAKAGEVIVCDSVSINLFKLAAAILGAMDMPGALLIEEDEFPTDQYMADSLAELKGITLRKIAPGSAKAHMKPGGVLIKSLVSYRTSEIAQAADLEETARQQGAAIIWDFSHATGIIPIDVHAAGMRYATGCTYKYLNGGPGAPAFIYVKAENAHDLDTPLPGWLGHAAPFAFEPDYRPAKGAERFVAGTPPILSMAALSGALDIFARISPADMYRKVQLLTGIILSRAAQMDLPASTPAMPDQRGGHVSLIHPNGYPIVQALAARGIKGDFRTPDTIRFGLSPLYLSYAQVWDVMDELSDIVQTNSWDRPEFHRRAKVT